MKIKLKSVQIVALFFFLVLMIGSILLYLPISNKAGLSYIDCLFLSTSATCVTGLSPVNISASLTIFGKIIIAILIQIGGLGFATLATFTLTVLRNNTSIGQMMVFRDSLNVNSMNLTDLLKFVLIYTFSVESFGALLNFLSLNHIYSTIDSIGYAIFHSISSFNNAGFDIFGTTNSLAPLRMNNELLLVTMVLIVIGGLGFFVHKDLRDSKSLSKLSLHSKIVILMTTILIILGLFLFYLSGNISIKDSLFLSISTRTAGFSTFDLSTLPGWSQLLVILFMLIGASPGSTGGGIKTTTAFVLILSLLTINSKNGPRVFNRTLKSTQIYNALNIFVLTSMLLFSAITLLQAFHPEILLKDLLFEAVSAFATVGLSTGITPTLNSGAKLVIIALMYIGRIGPLTLILSLLSRANTSSSLKYPEDVVFIG